MLALAPIGCKDRQAGRSITILAAVGVQPAITECAAAFTEQTGIKVECDFAGSGMLMPRVKLEHRGDLFMPGELFYLEQVQADGLVDSSTMVTYFVPVILVAKGNPKGIRTLEDLARPGVKLALGRVEACQIGRASRDIFAKNHIPADAIARNTGPESVTVNELGLWIKTGAVDATVVWDALGAQYADSAESISIPPEQNIISRVGVGVLTYSTRKDDARRFVEFMTSPAGQAIFEKHHYRTRPPDSQPENAP
jgi:molybdate transport system substrate-binding protein